MEHAAGRDPDLKLVSFDAEIRKLLGLYNFGCIEGIMRMHLTGNDLALTS